MRLQKLACGMDAPEFSANHAHESECWEPVTVDYDAAAMALERQIVDEDNFYIDSAAEAIVDAALGEPDE